ncbi:hypothetical protein [Streptomyces sp. enrichment culture]|uniref:hypothetical protein n=1 Tax=Streptomyces sp. enrichment culture TaxID=1795815 RepID=UPI003F57243C
MSTFRIASGRTAPGQGWQPYMNEGSYLYVDTRSAKFQGNPTYVASLSSTGGSQLWAAGVSSIYDATKDGFVVYLRWIDDAKRNGEVLTPDVARRFGFYVNWIGMDSDEPGTSSGGSGGSDGTSSDSLTSRS